MGKEWKNKIASTNLNNIDQALEELLNPKPPILTLEHQNKITALKKEVVYLSVAEILRRVLFIGNNRKESRGKWLDKVENAFPSKFYKHADEIKNGDGSIEDLIDDMFKYPYRPVFTAHPTNPRSLEADDEFSKIIDAVEIISKIILEQNKKEDLSRHDSKISSYAKRLSEITGNEGFLENMSDEEILDQAAIEINELMNGLVEMPLAPVDKNGNNRKLTVKEEIERGTGHYNRVMNDYTIIRRNLIRDLGFIFGDEYVEAHQEKIIEAINKQFNDFHTWIGSDADGNWNITYLTMRKAMKMEQSGCIEFYIEKAQQLELSDEVINLLGCFKDNVQEGNFFNSENDLEAKAEIYAILENESSAHELFDVIECFGFMGMKHDIRQSAKKTFTPLFAHINNILNDDIVAIWPNIGDANMLQLSAIHNVIDQYLQKNKDQKLVMNKHLSNEHFEEIKNELLSSDTLETEVKNYIKTLEDSSLKEFVILYYREINRLITAIEYPDNFKNYIMSDTEDGERGKNNFRQVRVLEDIAKAVAINRGLEVNNEHYITIVPLCETKQDIESLPDILRHVLSDPDLVKTIDIIMLFPGYSDIQRRMGPAGLIAIQKALIESFEVLENSDAVKDNDIIIKFFNGNGWDLARWLFDQARHSTNQGLAAYFLSCSRQVLKNFIYQHAGNPSKDYIPPLDALDNYINENNEEVDLHNILQEFIDVLSEEHQNLIFSEDHKAGKALYRGVWWEAAKTSNVSSRAHIKSLDKFENGAPKKDYIDTENSRAIGTAGIDRVGGWLIYILGSLKAVGENENIQEYLHILREKLPSIETIFQKTLFAAATCDFENNQILKFKFQEDEECYQELQNFITQKLGEEQQDDPLEFLYNQNIDLSDLSEETLKWIEAKKTFKEWEEIYHQNMENIKYFLPEEQRDSIDLSEGETIAEKARIFLQQLAEITEDVEQKKTYEWILSDAKYHDQYNNLANEIAEDAFLEKDPDIRNEFANLVGLLNPNRTLVPCSIEYGRLEGVRNNISYDKDPIAITY